MIYHNAVYCITKVILHNLVQTFHISLSKKKILERTHVKIIFVSTSNMRTNYITLITTAHNFTVKQRNLNKNVYTFLPYKNTHIFILLISMGRNGCMYGPRRSLDHPKVRRNVCEDF